MLKQKYFLTGIFILSAERQPIKLAWRKIVWLRQFTPEYTRPAAIGTTRAMLQGVEFEKWTGVVTDGKDDAGDGGNSGGGSDGDQGENPLG